MMLYFAAAFYFGIIQHLQELFIKNILITFLLSAIILISFVAIYFRINNKIYKFVIIVLLAYLLYIIDIVHLFLKYPYNTFSKYALITIKSFLLSLIYFKGNKNAPFAIINAGGGFSYVGSIHEGFPYAIELNKRGYNAFVLQYRVEDGYRATQDLARAISYIIENKDLFEVDINNYSLWGSSAGARMVAAIGSRGLVSFGEKNYSDEYVTIIKNETGIEVRKLEHLTTGAYTADSFEKFIKVDLDEVVSAIKYVKNKNKHKK